MRGLCLAGIFSALFAFALLNGAEKLPVCAGLPPVAHIVSVVALWSWTNHVIALRQISVIALFYLEDSRRIHLRSVRACQPKDSKRREL